MDKTEVENRGLDPEFFDAMCSGYNKEPFSQSLGLELVYLGKGVAGLKTSPEPKYSTRGRRVHGGIIATVADTVMGLASTTLGYYYRTVDINLNYLAPAFDETELTAEGYVLQAGKTIAVVESDLFNNEGKLIAKGRGTFIVDNKSTIYGEK